MPHISSYLWKLMGGGGGFPIGQEIGISFLTVKNMWKMMEVHISIAGAIASVICSDTNCMIQDLKISKEKKNEKDIMEDYDS